MDATVDDFLKEINEIVPPVRSKKREECEWQECFDDNSGFPYYWNVKSDEVTWEMPCGYKEWVEKKPRTGVTPAFAPPLPSEAAKIYKIGEDNRHLTKAKVKDEGLKYAKKKSYPSRFKSDSDDERIVLISSYGSDSGSDDEMPEKKNNESKAVVEATEKGNTSEAEKAQDSDEGLELELISKIHNKAQELQELGGEMPQEVKQIVDVQQSTAISGFSLVAGYGDDSDEELEEEKKEIQSSKLAHSTLFPITEPIDVRQFSDTTEIDETKPVEEHSEIIESKAFQRKRRIDVQFVNTSKKNREEEPEDGDLRTQGLGFNSSNSYAGFKSGGVLFSKSSENTVKHDDNNEGKPSPVEGDENIQEIKTTLGEKLNFLNVGKETTSAVQIMLIQMETLYAAFKAGSLVARYLHKWLQDTSMDLVKLERDAAPSGWLLQWDRSQKRYFYYHKDSGQSQWDFPEVDVVRGDDAMDISTTPPPPDENGDEIVVAVPPPPPPPLIKGRTTRSPSPTAAVATKEEIGRNTDKALAAIPRVSVESSQPLPPGVDLKDVTILSPKESTTEPSKNDSLTSVLDSFYSDIAAIENTSSDLAESTNIVVAKVSAVNSEQNISIPVVKKKKTKVKLTQGLAMKKKGVSKLVEKWKNVQKNYD